MRQAYFLQALTHSQLMKIYPAITVSRYNKSQYLMRQGDSPSWVAIIMRGEF